MAGRKRKKTRKTSRKTTKRRRKTAKKTILTRASLKALKKKARHIEKLAKAIATC